LDRFGGNLSYSPGLLIGFLITFIMPPELRLEGRAQARAGDRQSIQIYTGRCRTTMRGVRAPVVVEVDPVADTHARILPAGEGMQVDAFVLQ
jgi:hypothetical protein